jgi:hypothetical protein
MEEITKVTMGSSNSEPEVYKVDLDNPTTNETEEATVDPAGVVGSDENAEPTEEQETVQPEGEVQEEESPVLEEIIDNPDAAVEETKEVEEKVEEAIAEAEVTGEPLPEGIQKLVDFMKDTGGDISDYVMLNTDVSKLDSDDALSEYYKQTKPHLSAEERGFLLEETFGFDEDEDTDKDIKRKKIALKEEVAKAKKHLEKQKDKYYNEIKSGSKLTSEQQKAMDFFNRYNEDSAAQTKLTEKTTNAFKQRTNAVFNEEFKGFDFKVGEKKFRYNVKNTQEVKETQSDLNNFVNKFVGKDNTIQDAKGYHKSLFAAMNPDALAQHFYEQGKADAVKDTISKGKNINTDARQTHGETLVGGVKYKVLGDSSNDFKFKIKNKR